MIQISPDQAVRAFLPKVTFAVKKARVYLGHRQYSAEALFASDVSKIIAQTKGLDIRGYVIPELPRVAWLEIAGRLVEVESIKDGADTAHLTSLPEREAIAKIRSTASGGRQAQQKVDVIAAQDTVREGTGHEWHAGTTKRGRINVKTPAARDESRRITQPG